MGAGASADQSSGAAALELAGHDESQVPLSERRATLRCPVCRFRETTFELLGGVKELNFNKLTLGDDGGVQLAVVLPLCAKLTKLGLMSTQLGDEGAAALAGAIKGSGVVKKLALNGNHIGDAGAAALADALRVNGALTFVRYS